MTKKNYQAPKCEQLTVMSVTTSLWTGSLNSPEEGEQIHAD